MSPGRIKFQDIQLNLKEPEILVPDYKNSRPLGDVPGLASSIPDFSHLWLFLQEGFHDCAEPPPLKMDLSLDPTSFLCSRLRTSEGFASFPEEVSPHARLCIKDEGLLSGPAQRPKAVVEGRTGLAG